MTIDQVKQRLEEAGRKISKESAMTNGHGVQLRLEDGGIVNVFHTGTVNCQGANKDDLQKLFEGGSSAPSPASSSLSKKIFVAYGHDTTARSHLELMLRRWGLEPLILDELPSEGQTIIEKLERYSLKENVGYGVVLATPDDEGHKANHPDEKVFRARQNVVLELGLLLAKLGRKRVAILIKDQEKMERPSDIQGLIYIPFKNDLMKEAGVLLAKEMNQQGYQIAVKDL